jgi:hypothetical protein
MKITTTQAMIAVNATRVAFYDNVISGLKAVLPTMKEAGASKEDLDAGWKNVRHAEKQRAKAVEQQKDMKDALADFNRAVRIEKMMIKFMTAGIAPDFDTVAAQSDYKVLARELLRMNKIHFPAKADSRTPEQIAEQVAASAAKKAQKAAK